MDMDNNININIDKYKKDNNIEYIRELYSGFGYFDIYGGSVVLFILLTLFVFLFYTFCKVMQSRQEIADDWTNQRCNPKYIPFAGLINKPIDKGIMEYTNENFQHCIKNTTTNTTGKMLEPINTILNRLSNAFDESKTSIQNIRETLNNIRVRISNIVQEIYIRLINIMIPIENMFISTKDIFNKIQGVMTAGLYMIFGSYNTLQSLMGATLELIIKVLASLVIIIIALWVTPFTYPVAAAMTSVFVSISVPMAIIVAFMTEVLNVKTSALPKLRCFDENVLITLNNGSQKKICDIIPGEYLENNICVTSTIRVSSENLKMFDLHGIIVSESHIVKYYNIWIPVIDHPEAKLISNYNKPFLYCLNTTSKEIIINNCIFTDWDEIYGSSLDKVIDYINQNKNIDTDVELDIIDNKTNIYKYVDVGYSGKSRIKLGSGNFKFIEDICINDCLSTGGEVYGIVYMLDKQINTTNTNNLGILYNILSTTGDYEINGEINTDYNYLIDYITKKKNIIY